MKMVFKMQKEAWLASFFDLLLIRVSRFLLTGHSVYFLCHLRAINLCRMPQKVKI